MPLRSTVDVGKKDYLGGEGFLRKKLSDKPLLWMERRQSANLCGLQVQVDCVRSVFRPGLLSQGSVTEHPAQSGRVGLVPIVPGLEA